MNHEVIPTQADKICEQGIRDFLFHGEYLNGSIAASHRIAHEAPLLARIAELEGALEFYANPSIYEPHPHGPAFDRRDLSCVARAALAPTTRRPTMTHEVTPTQEDREVVAQELVEAQFMDWDELDVHDKAYWLQIADAAISSHRIAHEAPLLARNAELRAALRDIADVVSVYCQQPTAPTRQRPSLVQGLFQQIDEVVSDLARAALAPTKETDHDA